MNKREDLLWVERYRPRTIKDCILPVVLKARFQSFVDKGELPNFFLAGTPGTGKTTVAMALADELKADFIKINASLDSNIDTLRVKINQFASTVSFGGGRKIVLLDEADFMNPNSLQPALRGAIEAFGKNTGFILTANKKMKVMDAIQSRCPVIDFKFPKAERQILALEFFNRLKFILKCEKVVCEDDKILVEMITKHFPDMRRIIGELQTYSSHGKIDVGILSQISNVKINDLMKSLKAKDFQKVRRWVVDNSDQDSTHIFRTIYDGLYEYLQPKSIPEAVLILADYAYKAAFVADPELNLAACMVQLMVEVEFK
jgi:DNA polymerase III delta prime subunit